MEQVRILLPGCFDMMHAGHYNALRQAKGSWSMQKGPTVSKDPERLALVTACKWVRLTHPACIEMHGVRGRWMKWLLICPICYLVITPQLLDSSNCDFVPEFVAHGGDLPVTSRSMICLICKPRVSANTVRRHECTWQCYRSWSIQTNQAH